MSDMGGGDPVCWLHLACPECGAIPDPGDEDSHRCPRCGAQKATQEEPQQEPSEGDAPDR